MFDVLVIGAGPAGISAATEAVQLGANTALVTKDYVGGMATMDGPVPVRTLAHAARLVREATHLEKYGIASVPPKVDFPKLLERVNEVVEEVYESIQGRIELEARGVTIYEHAGLARFVDPHTIETESGLTLQGERIIICTGGHSRQLPVPGAEHCVTHSDAWELKEIPESMIVIGSGGTGAQVASIFNAFGTKIHLFELAPRILVTEDEDVSAVVSQAFKDNGMNVVTGSDGFKGVEAIEKLADGFRFHYQMGAAGESVDASLVVVAIGWLANAKGINLKAAGVQTDHRGYIKVDRTLQTNVPHIFAAGDVTGRLMLVPTSVQAGHYAAANALQSDRQRMPMDLIPFGSFTDPEYAKIGLTEAQALEQYDIEVAKIDFAGHPRNIIDGHKIGFCKMIADRHSHEIIGCHVVGERAAETVQLVAAGMKVGLMVEELADIPLSFPTYVAIVGRTALEISQRLEPERLALKYSKHDIKL